jgi:hypothetical protein
MPDDAHEPARASGGRRAWRLLKFMVIAGLFVG